MLKNISDYLSLMTLIFVSAYSVYVFLLLIVNREKDDTTTSAKENEKTGMTFKDEKYKD